MGLRNIITNRKEQRMMLRFYEDDSFAFENKEVEDTFLIERKNGRISKAWKVVYKLLLPFSGHRGIANRGTMVTLAYGRDIILDPFKLLLATEKPDKTGRTNQKWISDIATSQCFKRQKEGSKQFAQSTLMALLWVAMVPLAIGVLIAIVRLPGK